MGTFIVSDFVSTDTAAQPVRKNVAFDNFNRANGALGSTSFGGFAWSQNAGAVHEIVSNQLKVQTIPAGSQAYAWIDTPETDGYLSAKISIAGDTKLKGLMFRGQADGACYVFYGPDSGTWVLKSRSAAGGLVTLVSSSVPCVQGDVPEIELNGPNITCRVNGAVAITTTNTLYSGTRKGVWTFFNGGSTNNPTYWDDFAWSAL